MEITEKWLGDIGGWQAMKAARSLVEAGVVTVQSSESGLLRGHAGHGKTRYASGLRIRSRSDVENLCTCPASRRGMICDHSLAVALLWMKAGKSAPSSLASSPPPSGLRSVPAPALGGRSVAGGGPSGPPASAPAKSIAPRERGPKKVAGHYTVYLPENTQAGGLRDPLAVYIKFIPGGEEQSLLAAWLAEQGSDSRSAPLSVPSIALAELLACLAGHERVVAGRPSGEAVPLAVAATPVNLPVTVRADDDGEVSFELDAGYRPLLRGKPGGVWVCEGSRTLFRLPPATPDAQRLLEELVDQPVVSGRSLRWLVMHRQALADVFQLELQGKALESFHVAPVPARLEMHLEGSFQVLEATLTASFQGKRWPVGQVVAGGKTITSIFPIEDQESQGVFYVQDVSLEMRFLRRLEALGFKPMAPRLGAESATVWRLSGPDEIMRFYASDLPRLKHEVQVVEGERWRVVTRGVARIAPQIRQVPAKEEGRSSDGGWLAMEFGYEAPDGFRLPRAEVLRLVRSGQRTLQGKNGKRYLLDLQSVEEFEDTLRDVPLQLTPEGARLNSLHASYFFEGEQANTALPDEQATRAELGELGERLRPYQLLGVRWMLGLARSGRGGLLGDDMGLGKTVQSIAVTVALQNAAKPEERQPVLIVCPKSLTGNWRAEIERFAPALKVLVSQGGGRGEALKTIAAQDVIITTYQLIIRDLEVYKKHGFRLILLDEASYIRNPDTDAAKALRSLNAKCRLALTGTPVENSTRDLWSIYQFVLPGYLGSRETFKERFEQPIQSGMDTPAGRSASDRLKKLLRPWFLRRTKREVLKDLPEKIEQVLWCDPSPAQAEVYRRLLEEGREEIKAARKRSGQNGAKMTMFTVLLRLRQACCDLRLTGISPESLAGLDQDDFSGKWPMLSERLDEILAADGKVLIFSQFVQYLRLVREELVARKLDFSYLDGSSQDREAQVMAFQKEPEKRVFLISLKAGGYGLNLTAADHVILLDPWWNPAVEAQAIDRAHRMGQQKVVTACRLAMRGTVEERILALQAKKRGLVEAALDEQSPLMSGLQEDELQDLLS